MILDPKTERIARSKQVARHIFHSMGIHDEEVHKILDEFLVGFIGFERQF